MKCPKCGKPIKENTEGNKKYCQGHSILEKTYNCKDCGRGISAETYAKNKGKCDRCSIGDHYA